MKRINTLSLLLLLFVAFPMATSAQYDHLGNQITITEDNSSPLVYKLPNGLTVVLYADRSQPQVTGMVVTLAGGKNDPPEATGLAHYMEHMLFKGTSKIGTINWSDESALIDRIFELYDSLAISTDDEERASIQKRINQASVQANEYAVPNELDRILKEMGSTGINAGTGPDYTVYYNIFPPHEMERWLEVYSHRFESPVFRSFQAELEVVYEEKNMYSDMFFMNLFEEFNKHFYRVHPYGQQPLIGTIEHLKNPSLTRMKEFYETWYVANNMALILTGDFDIHEVMPLIQQKFGGLKSGTVPDKVTWVESPFFGREFVKKKLSPIKLGILGFRLPEAGHRDKLTLEIISGLLSNGNATGLLDKLSIDNKLLQAGSMSVPYSDYGSGLIIFVPKIIGQSLDDAEKLVLEQIDRLRKGEFSDTLLESVKLNLYKQKVMGLESTTNLAYAFLDAFTHGGNYQDLWSEPERLRKIDRDEIVKAASTYYGDDFLAFHSGMGFAAKPKIEKPGYEPVVQQRDTTSAYYRMISEMPVRDPEYRFVDFNNDISSMNLREGIKVYHVDNPKNDIFSLTFKYGLGEGERPMLKYASQMMGLAGTSRLSVDQFRLQMASIGCTYDISSDDSYLIVKLNGPEEYLENGLTLLGTLIQQPVLEQKKLASLMAGEKANRKLERSEPDMIADALVEYVLYGDESSYLNRLTMKQIKSLKADELIAVFQEATRFACEIHYVGKLPMEVVSEMMMMHYGFADELQQSNSPYYRSPEIFQQNSVFVTHKKKALQSKIFFHTSLEEFDPQKSAMYTAFNTYFGGDFSGIVLQEVREYRSMAYTAGASLVRPPVAGKNMLFKGYIGTQADKTNEAVDLFMSLVRDMPKKPERFRMIRRYISAAAVTQQPGFRSLSQSYVNWKQQGYEQDPAELMVKGMEQFRGKEVFEYQKNNLSQAPMVVIIAGNTKRFNTGDLAAHGKVVLVKEKKLFSK